MFTKDQKEQLSAPLNKQYVKERSQSNRSFSYIEGWHAIAEANRIFGFDSWSRETFECRLVNENACKVGSAKRDGWNVTYIARVRIRIGDIIRDGTGAGHGSDANLGLAHESAIKEAETDAMKRALMTFGNPFGLALYDKEQKEVVETSLEETEIIKKYIDEIQLINDIEILRGWWKKTLPILIKVGYPSTSKEADFIHAAWLLHGKKLKANEIVESKE